MSKKKGFTLIEMLVVVLIIGIIAAIALPQYQIAVLKTRYTQLMVMADALRKAHDAYYLANGKYTIKINDLDVTVPNNCTLSANGSSITCPHFSCTVYDGYQYAETLGMLYCKLRPATIGFSAAPKWGAKRYCFSNTDMGKKVCESFGARYAFPGNGNSEWYEM